MAPADWVHWLHVKARYIMAGGGSKAIVRSPVQTLIVGRVAMLAKLPKSPIVAMTKVRFVQGAVCVCVGGRVSQRDRVGQRRPCAPPGGKGATLRLLFFCVCV